MEKLRHRIKIKYLKYSSPTFLVFKIKVKGQTRFQNKNIECPKSLRNTEKSSILKEEGHFGKLSDRNEKERVFWKRLCKISLFWRPT